MTKQPTAPLSIEESWMDHPSVQWISNHLNWIGYGTLIFLLGLILTYRVLAGQSNRAEKDYVLAHQAILSLDQPDTEAESLQQLKDILKQYPELEPTYDGVIAQELLNQGFVEDALSFAKRNLNRVEGRLSPYFEAYANTSLVLSDGKTEEGLASAYQLKEQLNKELLNNKAYSPLSSLYVFNLIRISLVEKELHHKVEEKKAWDELSQLATGKHPLFFDASEIQKIMTHFDEQGAKLTDYSMGYEVQGKNN